MGFAGIEFVIVNEVFEAFTLVMMQFEVLELILIIFR